MPDPGITSSLPGFGSTSSPHNNYGGEDDRTLLLSDSGLRNNSNTLNVSSATNIINNDNNRDITDETDLDDKRYNDRQFTLRGIFVGFIVGTVLAAVNVYFGLQIFVQTVAVAVGCMSLTGGLIGVIPAIEKLLTTEESGPIRLSTPSLIIWSLGLAFFGVIYSVPLRKQFIVREKLKFPSGTATATMISLLHNGQADIRTDGLRQRRTPGSYSRIREDEEETEDFQESLSSASDYDWRYQTRILSIAFGVSAIYTLSTFFLPVLRNLPIFGHEAAQTWLWALNPSPAYIGQGIIMGQSTTLAMLFGAIIGWGVLSPLAKKQGWAPGIVNDWKSGSRGWIVWISLAIMLADSVVSLSLLTADTALPLIKSQIRRRGFLRRYMPTPTVISTNDDDDEKEEDAPSEEQIGVKTFVVSLLLTTVLCVLTIRYTFPQVPIYLTIISLGVAFVLSVMAARALGQTDLNPVSGISKIAQLFFALIVSKATGSAVLINLVAGAVSEAAGQQAGDILQDLKTSHLLYASPKAQFYGQLVGAAYGAVISSLLYRLYDHVYAIPSKMFEMPAAIVWIDCSRLLYGEGLPPYAREFCIVFGVVFAVVTAIKSRSKAGRFVGWLPGGIAVAIGMYNTPSFTLARVIGGVAEGYWRRRATGAQDMKNRETGLILVASGAIIGEGLASLVNLGLTMLTA
ncbi:uncharacterized protein DFL_003527 [Arthrobotrys flagrans]|uniref:OPT superfamily oligopeptide transporter n=1 Tax=Arthrobotrys flagrans TaxID=97331 RepID=A0A437A237_ARTFL|nr:hypothetical protein DFL_003527 [Arthrobotrys flagrans]